MSALWQKRTCITPSRFVVCCRPAEPVQIGSLVESQTLSVRFLATKAALPLPIGNDSCKVFVLVPFAPPRAGRFLLIETAAELSGD